MPPDVVSVWAPGRRLVNGYGPTECAVVATRAEMAAGRPIAIGWPIENNRAWVLKEVDGRLQEMPPGERGELCLGGVGLARGYWRAPELTAERFVEHPTFGRLYRTGDLASRTSDGELFCYGRLDSQVKVRGHRVELGDVESHIAHLPGVRAIGCTLTGHSLTALVVAVDPSRPPAAEALAAATAAELPSHMVPSRFISVEALPMTAGGKLDRPALAALAEATGPEVAAEAGAPPTTHLEALIASCVERALALHGHAPVDAHLFDALGADSLGAAEVVTALREHDETASVTVRDLYEAATVRQLAARIGQTSGGRGGTSTGGYAGSRDSNTTNSVTRTTVLQTLWMGATFVITAAAAAALAVIVLPWLMLRMGLVPFLAATPVFGAAGFVLFASVNTALGIVAKRRLIGRYTARTERMWGRFYLRHWLVQRAVGRMPWWLVQGTEFQSMLLRALGARVGQRVHLHRGVDVATGGWDLLTIGDDVTLGQDAALRPVEIEAGTIVVGPIAIDTEATVEVRAGLGPNTSLGRGATLTALSSLASGAAIPPGERWTGVPAEPDGLSARRPALSRTSRELTPVVHGIWMIGARLGVIALAVLPPVLTAIGLALAYDASAAGVLAWLASPTWTSTSISTVAILAMVPLPVTLALEAFVVRALGPIAPGVISRWSLEYVRVWMKGYVVDRVAPWLSGALVWRTWLAAAGTRIGPSAEVSTIIDVVPEQLEIGEGTFLTDGIYLGGPRVDRGTVTMGRTRLGKRVFIGNHAVVPCGQQIPDDVLVGVCTVADDTRIRPGSAWFGHPAFTLARRADEMDAGAFRPTWPRYVARIFFEVARFTLPVVPLGVAIMWFSWLLNGAVSHTPLFYGVTAPAVTLVAIVAMALVVFALKWVLLGRVEPDRHDFWSCWCFRWDLLYVAWQQLARPVLAGFEGTLLLAWYLRAMGARIGRRVVLGRGFAQVVDPDMLQFDDDATVRGLLQAHTFEGRVLKIDRVHVGRGATVGSQALLFYGTEVGDLTRVAAHSVVMKKERLPAGRIYEGCPTRLTTLQAEQASARPA
jgi:non-ribosomal peptide synthetase-like protein